MTEPAPALGPSDAALLDAARSGDAAAYGQLYERHLAAARSLARQLVRGAADADDVVADAFARVLALLRRGGGPHDAFRPYLLTAVRRVAYDRYRGERRLVSTGEIEELDPGRPFTDPAVEGLERSLIARAFLSLPERWRAVLWHTEIEGAKPADVAPLLGLTANGVAALSYRAREGLRQAYLRMHMSAAARPGCQPTLEKLGGYVRGGLSKRDTEAVEAHLARCDDCRAVYAELTDVNSSLRGVVAPIFLGPAAAGYLAAVKGAGWLARPVHWIRHAPNQVQAAAVGGLVAAVVLGAVLTGVFTGHNGPSVQHRHAAAGPRRPAAPPAQQPGTPSAPHHPPGQAARPGAGSPGAAQPGGAPGSQTGARSGSQVTVTGALPAPSQPASGGASGGAPGGGSGGGGDGPLPGTPAPPPTTPPVPPPPPPPSTPPTPPPPAASPGSAQLNISAGASTPAACAGVGVSVSGSGLGLSAGLGSDLVQGTGSCPPTSVSVSVSGRP